jgi:hypothetical protein
LHTSLAFSSTYANFVIPRQPAKSLGLPHFLVSIYSRITPQLHHHEFVAERNADF